MSYGGNRPRRKNKRPEKRWRNIAAQFLGRRTRSAGRTIFRVAWGAGGEGGLWGSGLCLRFTGGFGKESGHPWFADSRFLSNFWTESLWRRFHGKS